MKDKTCWHHDVCIIKASCEGCMEHSNFNAALKIAQYIIDFHLMLFKAKIACPALYDNFDFPFQCDGVHAINKEINWKGYNEIL
jgi:hypothetical protein